MIDKRTSIGKIIDYTKVVYFCLICNRRFLGDANTNINTCPMCKHSGNIVMDGNLVVRK